jgi:hypothetical protein
MKQAFRTSILMLVLAPFRRFPPRTEARFLHAHRTRPSAKVEHFHRCDAVNRTLTVTARSPK